MIDNITKENFWIRLYFNPDPFTQEGVKLAAVKRAYRDFSRTFYIKNANPENIKSRHEMVKNISVEIDKKLSYFTQNEISDLTEFDKHHKRISDEINSLWQELKYGQIQKWINMSLKYWLLLGEERVKGIELNAKFFHVPIDSIVLQNMLKDEPYVAWSQIDYSQYIDFQYKLRKEYEGKYLLKEEFELFNRIEVQ